VPSEAALQELPAAIPTTLSNSAPGARATSKSLVIDSKQDPHSTATHRCGVSYLASTTSNTNPVVIEVSQ
jgi:hypothetical protein